MPADFPSLRQFRDVAFTGMVWVVAVITPLAVLVLPSRKGLGELVAISVGGIALSCFYGYLDRRGGSIRGFRLRAVVPLALFGISGIVAGICRVLS